MWSEIKCVNQPSFCRGKSTCTSHNASRRKLHEKYTFRKFRCFVRDKSTRAPLVIIIANFPCHLSLAAAIFVCMPQQMKHGFFTHRRFTRLLIARWNWIATPIFFVLSNASSVTRVMINFGQKRLSSACALFACYINVLWKRKHSGWSPWSLPRMPKVPRARVTPSIITFGLLVL